MPVRPLTLTMLLTCAGILPAQVGDIWESMPNLNSGNGAPSGRERACGVWTGTAFLVWGGSLSTVLWYSTGGVYDPVADQWSFNPNLNAGVGAPAPRGNAVAAWSGDRLVVWGGLTKNATGRWIALRSGGVYDPATDTWEHKPALANGTGAPIGRNEATGVWTGTHLLVYGGSLTPTHVMQDASPVPATGVPYLWDGGMYDPAIDQWISNSGLEVAPTEPRVHGAVVWSGSRLLTFSGAALNANLSTTGQSASEFGRVFDPATGTWGGGPNLVAGVGAPEFRNAHAGIWTGTNYFVFGGEWSTYPPLAGGQRNTGGLYDPISDAWLDCPNLRDGIGAPTRRVFPVAHWTGSRALIYSGLSNDVTPVRFTNDGGLYDPINDIWDIAPRLNDPDNNPPLHVQPGRRNGPPLILYGGEHLFVWGGYSGSGAAAQWLNTGALYRPHGPKPLITSAMPTLVMHPWQDELKHTFDIHGSPQPTTTLEVVAFTGSAGSYHGATLPFNPAQPLPQPAPSWMALNHAQGRHLTITPPLGGAGHYTLRLTADNGKLPAAQATFTVEIRRPATTVPHNTTVMAEPGVPFSYRIPAAGYPTPIYIVNGLPSWMHETHGHLTGTPPPSATGTWATVDWFAANGLGPEVTGQLLIVVRSVHPLTAALADVNEDGDVNVLDLQRVINIVLAVDPPSFVPHPTLPAPAQLQRGDLDASGVVDVVDIQALVNAILGR